MNSIKLRKLYEQKEWFATVEEKMGPRVYASASANLEALITEEIQHLARRRHRRKLIKKGKL